MEDFLVTVLPGLQTRGGIWGQLLPNLFVPPQILLCSEKFVLNKWSKQNLIRWRCIFPSQTLKPGYAPGSAKILSAFRIFYFEGHSASRCNMMSKTFFHKSPLRGPCKHLRGGRGAELVSYGTALRTTCIINVNFKIQNKDCLLVCRILLLLILRFSFGPGSESKTWKNPEPDLESLFNFDRSRNLCGIFLSKNLGKLPLDRLL